jgi:hypothetical protein
MLAFLRTGAWLSPQRLRVYPLILLAGFVIAGLGLLATAHGGKDAYGHTLGADFSEIWTAGREVDHGQPARPYDVTAYRRDQTQLFGPSDGFYVWPYPPFFLAVAAALAFAPYGAAFALWQGTTLALYLAAVFAALRPIRLPTITVLVGALAFPATFDNLMQGQNGFLTAGLLGSGLVLLRRRPFAAGLCFALLAYKPHLGLLIVPALVAGGVWRTLAGGAVGLAVMTIASLAAFGHAPWAAFFAHLHSSRALLEAGAPGFGKLMSPFAAVRLLGGGVSFAYVVQSIVSLAAIVAVAVVWRSKADDRLKAALLMAANLIATPYAFDYDMVVLGPALAFALSYGLEQGFRPYEKSALALIWLMPLSARPAATALLFPLGPLAVTLFVAGLAARAMAKPAAFAPGPHTPKQSLRKAKTDPLK